MTRMKDPSLKTRELWSAGIHSRFLCLRDEICKATFKQVTKPNHKDKESDDESPHSK